MRIANVVNDSIVDGHGLRFTVFTQGCPHHCPGCHNPDTHDPAGGREASQEELLAAMEKNPLIEGLTLSGGEPFQQAEACAALAAAVRQKGWNVWTYTGYRYETLLAAGDPHWDALLRQTDVLVDGPFLQEEKSYELHFRGSRNQRLIDVPASLAQGKVILWEEQDVLAQFTVPES
ncbi:MAG: anaerobic ribonucleoside-triphosphate reductase activating protein [Evtepia sp.]|uniref:anaerobic ribonucleoside-triphosphate reductase activating protein n=1 Tax=Evtepia sp. TaxID=2773933 RepID=UPI002A74B8D1|nr:anaerobic ribonucleoside-triphosphate reductase activating protein [Evtepia sp.]MDY3014456.1 anaerobic ribonucleoside-triphosphate reductase activating protein [Evtepia sp.]